MRPPDGVQRGSVMDMPVYPGDPQTPGVGRMPGAKLIPLDQVQTITKIPVMPISYEDAEPFLKALGGQVVPEAWRGGLPLHLQDRAEPGEGASCAEASTGTASRCTTWWRRFPARRIPTSG